MVGCSAHKAGGPSSSLANCINLTGYNEVPALAQNLYLICVFSLQFTL